MSNVNCRGTKKTAINYSFPWFLLFFVSVRAMGMMLRRSEASGENVAPSVPSYRRFPKTGKSHLPDLPRAPLFAACAGGVLAPGSVYRPRACLFPFGVHACRACERRQAPGREGGCPMRAGHCARGQLRMQQGHWTRHTFKGDSPHRGAPCATSLIFCGFSLGAIDPLQLTLPKRTELSWHVPNPS